MSLSNAPSLLKASPQAILDSLDRIDCEDSHLAFVARHFPAIEGAPFNVGRHHAALCRTLDKVITGEITRLVVNIPPGFGKTLLATKMLAARGFAINPTARILHTSYSEQLVTKNGSQIRDIVQSAPYQSLWQRSMRGDENAKSMWATAEGGEFFGNSIFGQITGFRAGRLGDGFTGAMIIDDPIKPDDAKSATKRKHVTDTYWNTLRSRVMHPGVPIVVIMQRLHVEDLSGWLLNGGSGEKWHHLSLPALIEAEPPENPYTHAIPIDHGLSAGPLWDAVLDHKALEVLQTSSAVWQAQYQQRPTVAEGVLFKAEWIRHWRDYTGNIIWRGIFVDSAQKTAETNDYTVFQCWGACADGKARMLDQVRGRFDAPTLQKVAEEFWGKHRALTTIASGPLRGMWVEDKVSGTGLIQMLARKGIPVIGIPRIRDKITRAQDVLPSFAAGLVEVPDKRDAPWVQAYLDEILSFPDGAYDDQVDPTLDAVSMMCGAGSSRSVSDFL